MQWALTRAGAGGKVLFFPDQHLGRNTALVMGYTEEDDMAVWNPAEIPDWAQLEKSTFVLWHGYCSVHQRFKAEQIERLREEYPEAVVVVHPECPRETVDAADANGSTNFIREFVAKQPAGSVIGVGTEINLVQRLDKEYPDRTVICLDPSICPCSTMYMIHPVYLCDVLEALVDGEMKNVIEVDENTTAQAKLALDRMLAIRA
jgi:quinolinate synthase